MKQLLATAAALAISAGPAAALKIDSVTFPTNEYIVVILSDIPERAESVTCAFDDGRGHTVAVETDPQPDTVHKMIFMVAEDAEANNIKCWLGRDHTTEVSAFALDVTKPWQDFSGPSTLQDID